MIHEQVFEQLDQHVAKLRRKVRRERVNPPDCNIELRRIEEQRKHLREMESTRNKHLAAAIAARRDDDGR